MKAERGANRAPASSVSKRLGDPHFAGGEVSCFQGKTNHYQIETYNTSKLSERGTPLTDMPEYGGLVEMATEVYLGTYPNRNREKSIERMKKGLSHPRTVLMLALHDNKAVGLGVFPRLNTSEGPALYSSRAFQRGHDGQGLGTHVLERGIQIQQDESREQHRPLNWGTLMTQNELSIYTLRKLQAKGIVGKIFPFDYLYDDSENQKDKDADTARHIMLTMHNIFHIDSMGINNLTGVSRGELRELGINETYRRAPEDSELLTIYNRMVKTPNWQEPLNLDMHLPQGDVDYVTFELRKSGSGGGGLPLPLEEAA